MRDRKESNNQRLLHHCLSPGMMSGVTVSMGTNGGSGFGGSPAHASVGQRSKIADMGLRGGAGGAGGSPMAGA